MTGQDISFWRLFIVFTAALAFGLVITGRLVFLQVVRYEHYRALASSEHWREEEVPARRGAITDREGHVLAVSVDFDSLYAYPRQVKDPDRVAALLSPIINEPIDVLQRKLKLDQAAPVLLKRWLPHSVADQIRALAQKPELQDAYIVLKPEPKRVYPEGSIAPDTLGFVGIDGKGLAGLELAWDEILAGVPGKLFAERDTEGEVIALGARQFEEPKDGWTIQTTLDRQLQRIVERELDAAVHEWRAEAGTAVVLDPKTGRVLALANTPRFDLTDPDLYDKPADTFKNRAIQEAWEPGSIFKVVTMASALDAGAVTPDTVYDDTGAFSYAGITVRNWNLQGPGRQTMTDALARSSNVGLGTAATRLGEERFYSYLRAFGFGRPTGILRPFGYDEPAHSQRPYGFDLRNDPGIAGEAEGLLIDHTDPGWFRGNLVTNSFGQGIAVTPIQMVAAVAAIANGGTYIRPSLVERVISPDGRVARDLFPDQERREEFRRVISPNAARDLATMMKAVVDRSPTKPALIPGYDVAGKSGTAEVPIDGRYTEETEASYIAFLPYDDPKLLVLVRLTRPQKDRWAETVSAPTVKRIAQQAIARLKLLPKTPDTAVVDVGKPSPRVLVTDTLTVNPTATAAAPAARPAQAPASAPAPQPAPAGSSGVTSPPGAPTGSAPAVGAARQPTPTPVRAAPVATPVPTVRVVPTPAAQPPPVAPTPTRAAPPPTAVPAPVQPTARPANPTPAGGLPPPVNSNPSAPTPAPVRSAPPAAPPRPSAPTPAPALPQGPPTPVRPAGTR